MANPIVTSLPAYVEEHNLPLLTRAVIGAKSAKLFTLMSGVKGSSALNILTTSVTFGDGSDCGWDDAGSSTLSQRVLETGAIKVNQSFCDKKMLKTWAQYEVRVAAGQKTLPFEDEFIGDIVKNVAEKLETLIWVGNTSASSPDPFDGIATILGADSNTIKVSDNSEISYFEAVKKAVANIPTAVRVKDDCVVFCGYDTFYGYKNDLINRNLYHYAPETSEEYVTIAGTSIRLIPTIGLNGLDEMVAGSLSNFFYGTDMAGDEEKFEFWYSQDNREFRLAIEFNAGVQVAFPDEIVLYSANGGLVPEVALVKSVAEIAENTATA